MGSGGAGRKTPWRRSALLRRSPKRVRRRSLHHAALAARVFQSDGTILHTISARAAAGGEAIAAATSDARPDNARYDLETGARGERDNHIAGWLTA